MADPISEMKKMMPELDPSKMAQQFTDVVGKFQMPGVDTKAIMETQRKNLEAVASANRLLVEGLQAVSKRQTEILQQTMEEVSSSINDLAKSGAPQEAAAKQAELIKSGFEKALGNMRELTEMVAKSNNEATDAVAGRISESLDELRSMAQQMKK